MVRRKAIAVYNNGAATVEDCDLTENAGGAWSIAQGGYVRSTRNNDGEALAVSDPK
jgi:hypothetical protein